MTLHTGPGCQIGQDTTQFSGEVNTGNCDVAAEGQGKNVGCSIEHPSEQSYGSGLNKIGGGVYATQWTGDAISIFYFPRDSIPSDALGDSPDPSGWGIPAAKFSGGCDIEETFKEQAIVFDTTFCGQWAGSQTVWEGGSCAKKAATCDEFVRDNPEAFAEAYWTINALKVFQDNGEAPTPEAPSSPIQSTTISQPLPVSTINSSLPTELPPLSSKVLLSTDLPATLSPSGPDLSEPVPTSSVVQDILSTSSPVASVPLPTNDNTSALISPTPRVSKTRSKANTRRPTKPATTRPAAPTGANGMAGFQWPAGGGDGPDDVPVASSTAAPIPAGPGSPSQNSTGAIATPSTAQNVALPSNGPLVEEPNPAPTQGDDSPPAVPFVPVVTDTVEAVHTVYQTIYVTTTTDAAATVAPLAKNARIARHIREHRQRLTRHNMR